MPRRLTGDGLTSIKVKPFRELLVGWSLIAFATAMFGSRAYLRLNPYSRYRLTRQTLIKTAQRILLFGFCYLLVVNETVQDRPYSAQFRLHEQMARLGAYSRNEQMEGLQTPSKWERASALAAMRSREQAKRQRFYQSMGL